MSDEYDEEESIDFDLFDLTPDGKVVAATEPSTSVAPSKVQRYSATLLTQYQKCPASAYARITKQPENKSLALINGIALHESIEKYIKHRTDMVDSYKESFKENAERNELNLADPKLNLEKVLTDAEKMIANAKMNLDQNGFVDKIDPNLCEVGFDFERNGRKYVGKMDLLYMPDENYTIIDAKSSKNAPAQDVLDTDLQFTMYHYGAMHDIKLPTFGKLATNGVWWQLRGKNVAKDENGKAVRKVADKKYQYFFPTTRTVESIEQQFIEDIEPIVKNIEDGRWNKVRKDHCGWCSYYDKDKKRCRVELPKPL